MPFLRYLFSRPTLAVKYLFTRKCKCGTVRTLSEWRMLNAIWALDLCERQSSN
jgi:hypothetical protein